MIYQNAHTLYKKVISPYLFQSVPVNFLFLLYLKMIYSEHRDAAATILFFFFAFRTQTIEKQPTQPVIISKCR